MIRSGIRLRPSGALLGLALACFALGLAVAFILQWAFDGEARLLMEAKIANAALEQRIQDLETELRRNPMQRIQARPKSKSIGEPVKVQTPRAGPDGMPKPDRRTRPSSSSATARRTGTGRRASRVSGTST